LAIPAKAKSKVASKPKIASKQKSNLHPKAASKGERGFVPKIPSDDEQLSRTRLAIKKANLWLGFFMEKAAGAGLVGVGMFDVTHGSGHLISFIPDWELVAGGLPLLGAGQPLVQAARKLLGNPRSTQE
jgi:hypothetical protein